MNLLNQKSEQYIPNSKKTGECYYMSFSAHQDDMEIMAIDGILKAFESANKSFVGVVTTDGSGSSRTGMYKDYTDEQMKQIRAMEQKKAAEIGEYAALVSLNYTSSQVKDKNNRDIIEDYKSIIKNFKPSVIYTHNLFDKHDTHIGVVLKLIQAIRELDYSDKPKKVFGCEVWRGLDWLNDNEKVVFDVSYHQNLANSLLGVFDSQISGGKRYDLANEGRKLANATYFASHQTDQASHLVYANDLTTLCYDKNLSIIDFASQTVDRFKNDVIEKINKIL